MPDGAPGIMAIAVDSSGQAMPVGGGERGFGELVEDAPDMLLRFDALSGRMLYVNRAVERLTGYAPERVLPGRRSCSRASILPEQRPAWEASFPRLQETSARTFDLTVTRRDAATASSSSCRSIRSATIAGASCVLEGMARDITSLRAARGRSRRATKSARRSIA